MSNVIYLVQTALVQILIMYMLNQQRRRKFSFCFYNFRFNNDISNILLISRSKWPECNLMNYPCYAQYSGVIIYDDNRECETDNVVYGKTDSCFKPSFPTNDLL